MNRLDQIKERLETALINAKRKSSVAHYDEVAIDVCLAADRFDEIWELIDSIQKDVPYLLEQIKNQRRLIKALEELEANDRENLKGLIRDINSFSITGDKINSSIAKQAFDVCLNFLETVKADYEKYLGIVESTRKEIDDEV